MPVDVTVIDISIFNANEKLTLLNEVGRRRRKRYQILGWCLQSFLLLRIEGRVVDQRIHKQEYIILDDGGAYFRCLPISGL